LLLSCLSSQEKKIKLKNRNTLEQYRFHADKYVTDLKSFYF